MDCDQTPTHTFTLEELGLVDAPPEDSFDNLTKLASMILDAPVSLVSIVQSSKDRQYFKSQTGLPEPWATERQTPLSHSFCQHVVREDRALLVDNAPSHPLVKDNLAVPDLDVIAYLGVPVYAPTNDPVGALCVIDGKSRPWSDSDIAVLRNLAACVSDAIRLKAANKTNDILLQEREAAIGELRRSNRELDDFALIASHDLKEPLRALARHADFLSEEHGEKLGENGRKRLQRMIALSQRMEKLISDLLYLSRLGRGDRTTEAIDLNNVIAELKRDLAEFLNERNARIDIQESLPMIVGHPVQVTALFQNLISNGLKYNDSPEKIIEIGLAPTAKDKEATSKTIYVRDNGIGIDDLFQDDVFRMFKRLNSERSYGKGTGAGLAFVKKIVETHGGQIRLESKLGKGTTFFFTLPCENASRAVSAEDQAA